MSDDLSHIAEDLRSLAVDISEIKYDPQNANLHPETNLFEIAKSVKEYGQRKPVVVNRRTMQLEAGEGTLRAMKSLGYKKVAVVFVDDDPLKAMGYGLADNLTGQSSLWDFSRVREIETALKDGGADIQTIPGVNADFLQKAARFMALQGVGASPDKLAELGRKEAGKEDYSPGFLNFQHVPPELGGFASGEQFTEGNNYEIIIIIPDDTDQNDALIKQDVALLCEKYKLDYKVKRRS